ncbi:hypothetical protein JVU11DRAFT_8379 [Chiua virens]|nr:hypothetical protein JVU11DRAFT_8379 [Chiua virens]
MFTPNNTDPTPRDEISDLEWEIRTGRAIYILEQTLPDFFHIGLVSNVDPTRPDIVDVPLSEGGNIESIYSPTIRLTYTPPVALPPPFPRTLSLEGLPLYMTSSVFVRHTMKTLYSDLRVEMRKVAVQTSPPGRREKSLCVGLTVHGTTRLHTIDSIQPAPHQAAYDALHASLSHAFGFGGQVHVAKRDSH